MPDAVAASAARSRVLVLILFAALAGCAAWAIVRGTSTTLERTFLAGLLLLPLALPLPGLWRNDRRTYAWATLCLTPHVVYAITEAVANPSLRTAAVAMLLLAFAALATLVAHLRLTRPRSG
jgi:uncharacterized membrane protein